MASAKRLQDLLQAARQSTGPNEIARAEDAFFKALLKSTVYAHVPLAPSPPGRMRFVQFVRPDNGQTVLPFFSDREQAEFAAGNVRAIIAMAGRELLELTRGATLSKRAATPPCAVARCAWCDQVAGCQVVGSRVPMSRSRVVGRRVSTSVSHACGS